MKKQKILLAVILGSALALLIMGCGPQGGTITVQNDSTIPLTKVKISLGKSVVNTLNPGESMRASVANNIWLANVTFDAGTIVSVDPTNKFGKDRVQVNYEGTWLFASWTSTGISVENGEAITITVKDK